MIAYVALVFSFDEEFKYSNPATFLLPVISGMLGVLDYQINKRRMHWELVYKVTQKGEEENTAPSVLDIGGTKGIGFVMHAAHFLLSLLLANIQ